MNNAFISTNHLRPSDRRPALFLIPLLIICVAFSQAAQAVTPPPDGGYPGLNTAEGQNALLNLTSGTWNTAVGFSSLKSNTIGNLNTAIGINALSLNTIGINNTANGGNALYSNTTGYQNTANGVYALFLNTTGIVNTAMGAFALRDNTTGGGNTAIGQIALLRNSSGGGNTAVGANALWDNTTGNGNTAVGSGALSNPSLGNSNTAVGSGALSGVDGDSNTALGSGAGGSDLTGSNNVYIGAGVSGGLGSVESNTIRIGDNLPADPGASACFIGGINGQTTTSGTAVFINSSGKLGTITSSARFKKDIRPMDKTSEALFSLKPVSFRYKKEIDPAGSSQFGLVAEDVEMVNPDLVVRDKDGKPYTVRYDQVNAMLLNEFLKEHRQVEDLKAIVAEQQKQIEALTAGFQKVSAQLESSKPRTQLVSNQK